MGIKFEKVTHSYQGIKKKDIVTAIENINLNIDSKNEFVAIVGKTGSGKSTLISHMNALLLPTSGTVNIFDSIITCKKRKNPKLKPIRKKVGFVFQFPEYQLFEETVYKDIEFALKNFGVKEDERKKNIEDICKVLSIDDNLLQKSPFNLSGGQMRKVAIAGILAYDPQMLILDEPTRGLDPLTSEEIMDLFYSIYKNTNKSIVLISHDMSLVYRYATRVICLSDGKIMFDGKKEDLFKSGLYKNFNLEKPEILLTIDEINSKLNYNLDYNIHTQTELLGALRGVKYE